MLALTCPCTALSLSLSLLCRSTGMSSLSRRLLCRSIFCFRCRVLLLRISFLFLFFVYFVIIATSAATALRSPLLRFWPPFLSVSAAAAAVALPSPVRMRGFVLLLQWFLIFTALYNFNQCVWSSLAHTHWSMFISLFIANNSQNHVREIFKWQREHLQTLTVAVTVRKKQQQQQQQQLARNEKFGKLLSCSKCIIHTVRRTVDTLAQ